MSNASFYKWRSRFGGMDASIMTRLKELADKNHLLKKCMLNNDSKPKSFRSPCKKGVTPAEDWRDMMTINADSCFYSAPDALIHLKK